MFDFLAGPLGWAMKLVYDLVNNYFLAIFLFTLIIRLVLFPFSLQSQKKQADRIRLAPRLERLQKKYKQDPRKLQEKQQALYEKEGVSMTGGCLPLIVQMIVLFGVIGVIYSPLSYLSDVPAKAIDAAATAVTAETYTESEEYTIDEKAQTATRKADGVVIQLNTKAPAKKMESGYYSELYTMQNVKENKAEILYYIQKADKTYTAEKAEGYYEEITAMSNQFRFGNQSLLKNPWVSKKDDSQHNGFGAISVLWWIPIISGLTAVITSVISSYFSRQGMSGEKQPGQGCSNVMMLGFMPLFSLYISFTVPGGVGVYWICSNVIAILQTVVLNLIYNPKKIRIQAEIDYEERRRLRAEAKKKQSLAQARRLDDEREKAEDEAAARAAEAEKNQPKTEKKKKKEKPMDLEIGEIKDDQNG